MIKPLILHEDLYIIEAGIIQQTIVPVSYPYQKHRNEDYFNNCINVNPGPLPLSLFTRGKSHLYLGTSGMEGFEAESGSVFLWALVCCSADVELLTYLRRKKVILLAIHIL